MTVTVRFFAIFRERLGRSHDVIDLTSGATVASAWASVAADRPELEALRTATRFAVNGAYADPQTTLHDGDEIAFLPPMSGGQIDHVPHYQ